MKAVPVIVTPNSVTLILNGQTFLVNSGHPNFNLVREAVKEKRWDDVPGLVEIKKALSTLSKGNFEFRDGKLFYAGELIHNTVVDRIYAFLDKNEDFEPLIHFLERLLLNPSRRAVQELYKFLEHKNLPIDQDGYFYAYKAVRQDYYDKHSGKFRNRPGDTPVTPRNTVDDNADNHCSYGFHAGSIDYVRGFGNGSTDRIVIVKIDPADVVSIPNDCNCQKLRTCRYEVVADYTGELPETVYEPVEEDDYYFDGTEW